MLTTPSLFRTRQARMPGARRRAAWFAACCSIGSIGSFAGAVRAQTPSPLAEWQYSAGVPLTTLLAPAPLPAWQIQAGIASNLQAAYPGASAYRARVGPSIDIRYRDLFFLSTGEGVGVNLLSGPRGRVSLSAGFDMGRRAADDLDHLNGLGNIGAAAVIKLSGDYVVSKSFPLVLRADVRRDIGGSNGWRGDLSAYLPLPGSSERFFWFAGPSVSFADARYMDTWFGVSGEQARRSGLAPYSSHAGLRSVGFGTTAVWFFRKHWFLTVDGAIEQLTGSAAHSPVVSRSTQGVFDLSVNYRF